MPLYQYRPDGLSEVRRRFTDGFTKIFYPTVDLTGDRVEVTAFVPTWHVGRRWDVTVTIDGDPVGCYSSLANKDEAFRVGEDIANGWMERWAK